MRKNYVDWKEYLNTKELVDKHKLINFAVCSDEVLRKLIIDCMCSNDKVREFEVIL